MSGMWVSGLTEPKKESEADTLQFKIAIVAIQ